MATGRKRQPKSLLVEKEKDLDGTVQMQGGSSQLQGESSTTVEPKEIMTNNLVPDTTDGTAGGPAVETAPALTPAQAAQARASQLMAEKNYSEARKAMEEAEKLESRFEQAQAHRERAAKLLAEQKYVEARKALQHAEQLEAGPITARAQRMIDDVRGRFSKEEAKPGVASESVTPEQAAVMAPIDKSTATVNLYSKIAAGVGLLPGGLLNYGGILAVQVSMVWRIAKHFDRTEGRDQIRGSVLSLIGSAVPTVIGHGAGAAVAAIPAVIAGTLVYFLVTPVLAYAMTRAVGNAFIMHFESGGTLLTFDPKAFSEYFLSEFQKAGGKLKTSTEASSEATLTTAPAGTA